MSKSTPSGTREKSSSTETKATPAKKKRRVKPRMREIFLTGYPGFIGKCLLKRLVVEQRSAKVTLLVQEKFKDDAKKYIQSLPKTQSQRVRVLIGDVAKIDLGLSGPEVEELTQKVTHVFHLAAVQYLGVTREMAERVNVGGTRNMLMLAREMKKLERFVHFSTCYVSGERIGVITEDELDERQRFRNHYEETKFRAEKLVRSSMGSLPITVIRPSIVVGDSETGEIDRFNGVYAMGIFIIASPIAVPLPLPGDGVAPLNVVPIDFVTRATVALTLNPKTVGETFHLVDPNPLSSRHVYKLIAAKAGKKLPRMRLSYALARRVLKMPIVEKFARSQTQALDYLNHLAIYNCARTLEHLEGTGILCPRIDTYFETLMQYVQDAMGDDIRALPRGR